MTDTERPILQSLPARQTPSNATRILALIRLAARVAGALAIPLIIWLSLIPGNMQTRTPLPKQGEHFIAYVLTAACIGLLMERSHARLRLATALTLLAGVLEIGQAFIPGRTPGLGDFVASASGAWTGVGVAALVVAMFAHKR